MIEYHRPCHLRRAVEPARRELIDTLEHQPDCSDNVTDLTRLDSRADNLGQVVACYLSLLSFCRKHRKKGRLIHSEAEDQRRSLTAAVAATTPP